MTHRLVLVGAGHAHMLFMATMPEINSRDIEVTVISPHDQEYYSSMGPGMLGGRYRPDELMIPARRIVESGNGNFILDKVAHVNADEKFLSLKSGTRIAYDAVSFNIGSRVSSKALAKHCPERNIFAVKPVYNLLEARRRIIELAGKARLRIGVIGGGSSGLEVAANSEKTCLEQGGYGGSIRIYCGSRFLGKIAERPGKLAHRALEKRKIEILEGSRVKEVSEDRAVTLEDGRVFQEDLIFLAPGIKPPDLFLRSGLKTGPDGGLRVNKHLQCPDHPELFGAGDCIYFQKTPLDKVGVYAVRQSPVLYRNLIAFLRGKPLEIFHPGGNYLLAYNLGDGRGIIHKGWLAFNGRSAFRLKNHLDRKFMKIFLAWK